VIVTKQGPIDRHLPGADVTGLYPAETVTRLVKEGYLRRAYREDAPEDPLTLTGGTRHTQEVEVIADDGA
jgi:hypothetical protein